MPRLSDVFQSNYLKAPALAGRAVSVVIRHVTVEPIGRDREIKLIAYFEGKQKGFILNKTNARTIAALAGTEDTDRWPGVHLTLFATPVEFQGAMVEAIRIKGSTAAASAPPPPPAPVVTAPLMDDDIPF